MVCRFSQAQFPNQIDCQPVDSVESGRIFIWPRKQGESCRAADIFLLPVNNAQNNFCSRIARINRLTNY